MYLVLCKTLNAHQNFKRSVLNKNLKMPCLRIHTNLPKEQIPEDFVSKMIPVLSQALNKPEKEFVVVISTDCTVAYGEQPKNRPGAVATLESIGHLGLEENKIIARDITDVIDKELGIPPEQFLLTFYDFKGLNVAKFGVTFPDK